GAGGLFRLGLEVGLFSMQAVDGVIWEKGPGARFFEPRRRYAAFVTGLCLHFYQALTGMHVYDEAGETWPAFQESLWQWVKQRRQYQVQPVQEAMPEAGRHLCTILVLNRIMPRAGLQFLLEGSSQLLADMLLALQAEGHDSLGKFGKMIHAMDEKVREREAKDVASLPFFMQEESAVERVDPAVSSEQSNPGSAIFTNTGQEEQMDKNTFPAARCSRVGVILPSDVQEKGPGTDSSGSGRILAGEKRALSGQARTVLEGMVKSWKDGTNPDVRLQPQGLAISLAGLMSQDRRGADIRDELWNLGWLYQDSPDCLSRTYPVQIGARQVQCVIVLADIARKLGWLSSDSG
ncbi:MAG: TraI domain-containing protein, partial [Pseudomonadota bacterium]|nr:TraI domain-containing protein [Pseudomonadota bacterium]